MLGFRFGSGLEFRFMRVEVKRNRATLQLQEVGGSEPLAGKPALIRNHRPSFDF